MFELSQNSWFEIMIARVGYSLSQRDAEEFLCDLNRHANQREAIVQLSLPGWRSCRAFDKKECEGFLSWLCDLPRWSLLATLCPKSQQPSQRVCLQRRLSPHKSNQSLCRKQTGFRRQPALFNDLANASERGSRNLAERKISKERCLRKLPLVCLRAKTNSLAKITCQRRLDLF